MEGMALISKKWLEVDSKYIKVYGENYLLIFLNVLGQCSKKLLQSVNDSNGATVARIGVVLSSYCQNNEIDVVCYNLHSLQAILKSNLADDIKEDVIKKLAKLDAIENLIVASGKIDSIEVMGNKLIEIFDSALGKINDLHKQFIVPKDHSLTPKQKARIKADALIANTNESTRKNKNK